MTRQDNWRHSLAGITGLFFTFYLIRVYTIGRNSISGYGCITGSSHRAFLNINCISGPGNRCGTHWRILHPETVRLWRTGRVIRKRLLCGRDALSWRGMKDHMYFLYICMLF